MNNLRSFLFSLASWLVFIGLFVLVRFLGTDIDHFFLNSALSQTFFWLIGSLIFAIVFWLSLIIENTEKMRKMAYYKLILLKSFFLLLAIWIFTLAVFLSGLLKGVPLKDAWIEYIEWLATPMMLGALLYIFFSAILISFIWQMTIKVGPNMLVNLLLGRYHVPRSEDRMFMFLDLKSSTPIAEKIGDIQFSLLIKDCFADLTESAIAHRVEIYKYVGDEAVLTWKLPIGVKDNNCIHTFFDFQLSLLRKKEKYMAKFGIFPVFKAGINAGNVVATEVGIIKREVAFLSDVINTAAAVQGKCNELEAQVLVTENVYKSLEPDDKLVFQDKGEFELKGKQSGVRLFDVRLSNNRQ